MHWQNFINWQVSDKLGKLANSFAKHKQEACFLQPAVKMHFSKNNYQFIMFGQNHQKVQFFDQNHRWGPLIFDQKLISKCMSQFITVYQNGIHKINLDHICNSTCNCNGRSNTNQMLTANQPQFIKFAPVYQPSLVQKWSSTLRFHQTGA